MNKFVIKGPGRYRTRAGDIAYVVNNVGESPFVWRGLILDKYISWTVEGKHSRWGEGHEFDLIEYLGPIGGEGQMLSETARRYRRQKIATAVLAGIYAAQPMPDYADEPVNKIERRDRVEEAILAADALIAELNKE